jgi:type II secretory ATPase GspE/PulE/Tfp pilus assembly ATPase PilB-like protein
MLSVRDFKEHVSVVTVGLLKGHTLIGAIRRFSPLNSICEIIQQERQEGGRFAEVTRKLEVESISFLAFHKDPSIRSPQPEGELVEYQIMTKDGQKFTVDAGSDDIASAVGFYARPTSTLSPFAEFFFFAWGVRIKEDRTPLGQVLLEQQKIESEDLKMGLDVQKASGQARVGEILAQEGKVKTKEVDEAVTRQQRQWVRSGRPMRLGEILVAEGLASIDDIDKALEEQKKRKDKKLGEVLVDLGLVSEKAIGQALATKFQLPFVDLEKVELRPEAMNEIPIILMERYRIFPYFSDAKNLHIAISDPLAIEAISMLQFSVGKRIEEVVASGSQIESYIRPFLDATEDSRLAASVADDVSYDQDDAAVRLLNRVIIEAYRKNASDIHIEPMGPEDPTRIRFRVDGQCSIFSEIAPKLRSQLTARIKIMAGLDISERRRPQDGKIEFQVGKRVIELRVATIPTGEGEEDVVMRILAAGEPLPLANLGLSTANHSMISKVISDPYGLILAVGPTGSGKTTTLHSLLGHINTVERKIWTAEDPIEISQKGLRQVQVNPRIGFTFAAAMRSFLRADPDVIMVGEMRDEETASIGIEASLTGHLVFSTLHTNSAPETITRLLDMGLDPFSFSDALLGIIAQRLGRRLCKHCKEKYTADAVEMERLQHLYGAEHFTEDLGSGALTMWRGKGCERCGGSGCKGRLGIHEVLVNNDEITRAILKRANVEDVRELALKAGMRTLLQDGICKVNQGVTDLPQVLAVCSQ